MKIRSLNAPRAASCPGNDIFLLFLSFTYIFLRKLAPWMPPGWMPRAVAPHLHATAYGMDAPGNVWPPTSTDVFTQTPFALTIIIKYCVLLFTHYGMCIVCKQELHKTRI